MAEYEFPPKYITIVTPRKSVIARGSSSDKHVDPQRSIRLTDEIYETLGEASRLLNVTRSEFIRWVAYDAANQIIGKHKEYEKFKR